MPIDSSNRINVGVLVERASGERRVALIPADIQKLISKVMFVFSEAAMLSSR
jgi:alanine dehydrogenase